MARYESPQGTIVRGWTVRLEPTPEQVARFHRDCGARRFARNWAVAQIRQAFEAGSRTGQYDGTVWSAYSLRKRWNTIKGEAAPWWAECSKEAYSTGIADAVTALRNWHDSTTGKRQGPAVRFPRFRKKTKDSLRCTYTTGAMRVDGSRHVVLPGLGRVETSENIRALWRHVRRGTGRVMSATIGEKAGRWYVSLRLEIKAKRAPEPRTAVAGADLGIGRHLLIVMRPDGTVTEKIPNPRALRASLTDLRRANRALARKHDGTPRWRAAKLRLGRAHARAANIRTDAIHQATTRLAKTHGAVVIEDLAPRQHMGGLRSHRKSWTDAAAGEIRRQLDPGGLFATGRARCSIRAVLMAMILPAVVPSPRPGRRMGMSCLCSLPPGRSRIRRSPQRSRPCTVPGRRNGRWRWRSGTGWASGWPMRTSRPRSGSGAGRAGRRRGWRW